MNDIKHIKENVEFYKENFAKRKEEYDLKSMIAYYDKAMQLKQEIEFLRAERNKGAKEFETAQRNNNPNLKNMQTALKKKTEKVADLTAEYNEVMEDFNKIYFRIPNLVDYEVPAGGKEANTILKEFGEKPKFNFKPKNHIELCRDLKLIDYERAIKIAGEGNWIYTGLGARLEWAILNYCIDQHLADGYEFKLIPHILKYECGFGAGQFPKFENDDYFIDRKFLPHNFLLPTAETALTNLHREEVLTQEELPKKYFAYSPCFRIEAGSNRPDEKGMIRGHQFNKIEMVQFTTPDQDGKAFNELLVKAERIVQELGWHYKLVKLAAGDIPTGLALTYDIEIYLPSINRYTEVSSVSTAHQYQGRRTNTRYVKSDGEKDYVCTLNASGIATSRVFPAILEQFQNADGSVNIPECLQKYMGGMKVIK
jgi:seryl-tRNA synthetase